MTDEALLSWIDKGQLVAALLVAIGVAGEFVLQFTARPISRRIEFAREIEIAQQRERTANAERALAELQERARPRMIDSAARATIIDWLRSSRPDGPIDIEFVSGSTTEPVAFAREIRNTLEEAGWTVSSSTGGPYMGNPPVGLTVTVPDEGDTPLRATVLHDALAKGGLAPKFRRSNRIKAGNVTLVVGLKP